MPIIINGGSYSGGGWWSRHLQRTDTNARVEIVGFANLSAETIPDAFREMEALAAGTRCKNYFYQANINPRADEHLTPEQRDEAVDRLERNLGLAGQPRFVVEHEKEGRTHWHVVWSRIDTEQCRAISDSLTAAIHEHTSRELEIRFDLERGQSILTPNRETGRERRPPKAETFRAAETGVDIETVKADTRAAREQADNGHSFQAALEASGDYVLARGDRRDFVIVDRAGDDHSLARRIGMKAAEVRAYMADLDPACLPSVAEAKALQAERQQAREAAHELRPVPEIEKHGAGQGAAQGPYAELRATQTENQFAAVAERVTAPRPETFDRDASDADWNEKLSAAAIAAHEAAQRPRLTEAAQQRIAAIDDRPPQPERELKGTPAEIRAAWSLSGSASELEDALASRGIGLALVSAEEAYASERHAALAKAAGNFSPAWREGEIVAVDGYGAVYRLDARTTGDDRGEIEGRLAGIDRATLMNVADTQDAMCAASLEAWKAERRVEREQDRPANAFETAIGDALASTMTGTEFVAALDEKGLAIARATSTDVQALEALHTSDFLAGTTGEPASGRRFADLIEGDFAAVTRQGDVIRLSPHKLALEEIEQRLADVQTRLPSVVEARAHFEEVRERKAEERAQREADFVATGIEISETRAGQQELRQAVRAAETVVHAAIETPAAAVDKAADVAGGFLGGAAKIVESVVDFFGGLFGGPKLTRQQVHDQQQAAGNVETQHAAAVAAEAAKIEAEHDERIFRRIQEQQLPLAAPEHWRAITRSADPAMRKQEEDRGLGLEQRRDD